MLKDLVSGLETIGRFAESRPWLLILGVFGGLLAAAVRIALDGNETVAVGVLIGATAGFLIGATADATK